MTKMVAASELKAGMRITDKYGFHSFVTRDAVEHRPGQVCFYSDLRPRPTRQEIMTFTRPSKLYNVTGAA